MICRLDSSMLRKKKSFQLELFKIINTLKKTLRKICNAFQELSPIILIRFVENILDFQISDT